jgi:hypothetical protein
MTVVYLGVVVLPLLVLVWNLGLGSVARRRTRLGRPTTPIRNPVLEPRMPRRRLRNLPAAFLAGFRAARAAVGPTPPSQQEQAARRLEIAPDLPRSPSVPGWVPAQGYSAVPVADDGQSVRVA